MQAEHNFVSLPSVTYTTELTIEEEATLADIIRQMTSRIIGFMPPACYVHQCWCHNRAGGGPKCPIGMLGGGGGESPVATE